MSYASGQQNVSPIQVAGGFPYNGGAMVSQVPAHGGTVTVASGAATVADTNVTANSIVIFTLKTASGTVAAPFVETITPGTGFTVGGGASDDSTYNYLILG